MKTFHNSSEQSSFVVFKYEGSDDKQLNLYLITDEETSLQTLASHKFISQSFGFGKGFYFIENPQDLDSLDIDNKCLIECQVKIGKSIILTIQNAHNAEELMKLKRCQSVKGYLNETQKFYIIYNSSQIMKTIKILEKEFQIVFNTTYPKCKNHLCLYQDKHHSGGCHSKCSQKNCVYFFKYHPSPCKLVCTNSNYEKFESYHESESLEKCQNKYCKCFKSYHEGPCTNLAMNEVDNSEEMQLNRKPMHTKKYKNPRLTADGNSNSPNKDESNSKGIENRVNKNRKLIDEKQLKPMTQNAEPKIINPAKDYEFYSTNSKCIEDRGKKYRKLTDEEKLKSKPQYIEPEIIIPAETNKFSYNNTKGIKNVEKKYRKLTNEEKIKSKAQNIKPEIIIPAEANKFSSINSNGSEYTLKKYRKLTEEEKLKSRLQNNKPEIIILAKFKIPPQIPRHRESQNSILTQNQNLLSQNRKIENAKLENQKALEINYHQSNTNRALPLNPIVSKFQSQSSKLPEFKFQERKIDHPQNKVLNTRISNPIIAQVPEKKFYDFEQDKYKIMMPRVVGQEKNMNYYASSIQRFNYVKQNEKENLVSQLNQPLLNPSYEIPIIGIPRYSDFKNPTISNVNHVSDSSNIGCFDSTKQFYNCYLCCIITMMVPFMFYFSIIM